MTLKKSEIEVFKQRLEELQAEMTKMIQETTKDVKSDTGSKGYSQHQADEGTDDFVLNVNLQLTDKELEILKQIERALEKIEEGTYGVCDISDEKIPVKRLEAIPYANMTVEAQEKFEKGQI